MRRKGTLLNEATIRQFLGEIVGHLEAERPRQAELALDVLAFERLTELVRNHRPPIDLSIPFGHDRVAETATHVRACEHALKQRNIATALFEAKSALARWMRGRGE